MVTEEAINEISLKEFGLSEYEERIYLSLFQEGPLRMKDLAVKTGIPRAKVYSTVVSLKNKGLIKVNEKPWVCVAISPEESLAPIVKKEKKRVEGIKKGFELLKKLWEERPVKEVLQEKSLKIYTANSLKHRLKELFHSLEMECVCVLSFSSFEKMRDTLSQVSLPKGAKVTIITSYYADPLPDIPGVEVRFTDDCLEYSIYLFDSERFVVTDEITGLNFECFDSTLGSLLKGLILRTYCNAAPPARSARGGSIEPDSLLPPVPICDEDESLLVKYVEKILEDKETLARIGSLLLSDIEERFATHIFRKGSDIVIPMLLRLMNRNGCAMKYDRLTGTLSLGEDAVVNGGIWFLILLGFLKRSGLEFRLLQNAKSRHELRATRLRSVVC